MKTPRLENYVLSPVTLCRRTRQNHAMLKTDELTVIGGLRAYAISNFLSRLGTDYRRYP
jgi:hypothetical protein